MNEQLEHTVGLLARAAKEENKLEMQIMYRALLTFGLSKKLKFAIIVKITDGIGRDKIKSLFDALDGIVNEDFVL